MYTWRKPDGRKNTFVSSLIACKMSMCRTECKYMMLGSPSFLVECNLTSTTATIQLNTNPKSTQQRSLLDPYQNSKAILSKCLVYPEGIPTRYNRANLLKQPTNHNSVLDHRSIFTQHLEVLLTPAVLDRDIVWRTELQWARCSCVVSDIFVHQVREQCHRKAMITLLYSKKSMSDESIGRKENPEVTTRSRCRGARQETGFLSLSLVVHIIPNR
jgi:hypothetical protein